MGLKVYTGGLWKTVTAPAKYSTDGGTTWIEGKRLNFYDPVTGTWQKGVWGDLPPSDIVSPTVTFSWTGSQYTASAQWAQVTDSEGDFSSLQTEKIATGGSTTTTSVSYSSLSHASGTTTYAYGAIADPGYTELTFRFRIVDAGGQTGTYTSAPAVRVPPGPVTGLSLAPSWNGTRYDVLASWTAPGGSIGSYKVQYKKDSGSFTTVTGVSTTSYTVPTAANSGGSTYTIRVFTVDPSSTESPYTEAVIVLPPDDPASSSLTNLNTSTATFSWTAPTNGVLTGYRYRVALNGGAYSGWTSVGTGTTSITIALSGNTSVDAQVQTVNTASGQTNSYGLTQSGAVQPPTPTVTSLTFTNNSSLSANWSVGSGNITNWNVQYQLNGASSWTTYASGVGNSSTTSYTTTGQTLTNNTVQRVRVGANYNGTTVYSAEFTATNPSTVGTVTCLFTSGKPSASWTHLSGNTGYTVVVTKVGGSTVETNTVGAVGTWTASSATPYETNSTYQITVQGYNAAGTAANIAGSTNVKKLANPIIIDPVSSLSWQSGTSNNTYIFQGTYDTTGSPWFGALYYSNRFYDALNSANIGYTPTISSAGVSLWRQDGGVGSARFVCVCLHKRGATGEGDPTSTRSTPAEQTPALYTPSNGGTPQYDWVNVPVASINSLIAQTSGYKGIGFYDTDTTVGNSPPLGTPVTDNYMRMKVVGVLVPNGSYVGQVRIYHSG